MRGRARSLALAATLAATPATAADIRVAAATNVKGAIAAVAERFEEASGHRVTLIFGSTGKHYAQIVNGAPFDAFFAADDRRPRRLEAEGVAVAGSRFTYAVGRLALWSPGDGYVDPEGRVLGSGGFRRLAIANPRLAPYGEAARQTLVALGLWEGLEGRLVRGENVGQAFQFVDSGNAELGFVAWSQLREGGEPIRGSYWRVPPELHSPIEQQAVLLEESRAARDLLAFVRGPEASRILADFGYEIP